MSFPAFYELENVAGSTLDCIRCGRELPRKGTTSWFDKAKNIASFWTIRCPDCRQAHIIFNRTDAYIPTIPTAEEKPPPDPDPIPGLL